jgi:hypothetical protein
LIFTATDEQWMAFLKEHGKSDEAFRKQAVVLRKA